MKILMTILILILLAMDIKGAHTIYQQYNQSDIIVHYANNKIDKTDDWECPGGLDINQVSKFDEISDFLQKYCKKIS